MPRLAVALALGAVSAFAPVSQPARSTLVRHAEDPTKVWYAVPAIWIDGVYAGGCNDGGLGGVVKLDQQGRLDELLKAAGAV